MIFEPDYFNAIAKYLNEKDNAIYNVSDLTETPDRFIFHVKYYIDHRRDDMAHVEFNDDYSRLRVLEFFEGKIKENESNKITARTSDVPREETSPAGVVSKGSEVQPIITKKAKSLFE